ncbi:MAG TPA: RNA polymerase sigma factor [Kofleriaceae bacterium]|nr:RNA polymerase sigma factor [Kofleriaceae bacterium]
MIEVIPHLVALRGTARRLGREPDDLVQETYLRALAARRSYRPGSNAKAWLHRILVNVAMTEHRKRARDRRLEARLAAQPEPEPIAAPEPLPQSHTDLRAALLQLTSADQEVVRLADLEGLRYRDVARVLGCPLGTVMSRLHRARRRLRQSLAQAA